MAPVATWNDCREGTIIEPSPEFGYGDLEVIQRLRRQHVEPGFSPRADDLRLPRRLYMLRKAAGDHAAADRELVDIANRLAERSTRLARQALDRLEARGPARRGHGPRGTGTKP